MERFRFYTPTEVEFGKDAELVTGQIAAKYGKKALLVYGKGSVVKSGLLGRVEQSLEAAGVAFEEFGGAKPNPTLAHAKEGVQKALSFGADMIIGVGGGSAIDTAKAIAHGAGNPDQDLWALWTRKAEIKTSLPVGAVLTIAAAGSEMSDSAVLTNEEMGKKAGINTEFNRCRFAIMNPALAKTLPAEQIAAGITDIMMHTMERYFIPDSNCDLTDEIAEGLLRTMVKNGPKAMADPSDENAMGEIFWASSLSHNNLTECGRGKDFSVHKLGHALSARYDVTHGASLSAVWGSWARELMDGATARFVRFAESVWGIKEGTDEEKALSGIEAAEAFFKSIHMPVSLRELGVSPTEEEIKLLALDATMQDSVKLSRIRPLDAAAVEKIYRAAMKR
ncbi:MAG: iron-containing alcohol dehydrogenase [Lachnospiraceae bacterium]|nr:iron-containing alcohol dehydrogenase [Lachnospiraceae bacterium]